MQELGVIAKWGKPVWEFRRREVPLETETRVDRVGEITFELSSEPRDPTPTEAYAALGHFVYTWRQEHPDYEVIYLEVSRSSPQRLRMQFRPLHASPLPPLAVIAAWIVILIKLAFIAVVAYLILRPVAQVSYELTTSAAAVGKAAEYLVYIGAGFLAIWGFSKVYPAIRGKKKS